MAELQVTVIEGRNLKKKDLFSPNDTFVEIYLDDKSQKQKTTVKRNSKNPTWNEILVLYRIFVPFSIEINLLFFLEIISKAKIFFMLMFTMMIKLNMTKSAHS